MTGAPEATATDDEVSPVDPFDLPEWLGTAEVVWTAATPLVDRTRVEGRLAGGPGQSLDCDLLAVDQAWPRPVVGERWRSPTHGEWGRGEVLLLQVRGRLTLAMPGTAVDPAGALAAVGRLARAVGVPPARFLVTLRP